MIGGLTVACEPSPRWFRGALATLLILGTLGTAYEVFIIRMSPILYDRWQIADPGWLDTDRQGGRRTYALRRPLRTSE